MNIEFSDDKVKHLEFVEGCINRMSSNSFSIKGWMVAIVAALLALYADTEPKENLYLLIASLASLLFWIIDSFYLFTERCYTTLYKDIIREDTNVQLFDMSIDAYKTFKAFCKAMFGSVSTIIFYLPVMGTLLAIYIVHLC